MKDLVSILCIIEFICSDDNANLMEKENDVYRMLHRHSNMNGTLKDRLYYFWLIYIIELSSNLNNNENGFYAFQFYNSFRTDF